MARLPLPPSRPVLWPLRTADPDRSSIQHLPHHRMRITIDHEPLPGITPSMLLWWFQHIGDVIAYGEQELSAYLVWHPLDHIRWDRAQRRGGRRPRAPAAGHRACFLNCTRSVRVAAVAAARAAGCTGSTATRGGSDTEGTTT